MQESHNTLGKRIEDSEQVYGKQVTGVSSKGVWLAATLSALLAMLLFSWYGLQLDHEKWTGIWAWIQKSAINFYFSMLLVFAVVFLAVRLIPQKRELSVCSPQIEKICITLISGSVGVGLLRWLMIDQISEFANAFTSMPVESVPNGISLALLAAFAVLLVWTVKTGKDISQYVLFLVYAVCLVLTLTGLFYPNVFAADLYHGVAVLETIYNVYDLTPFTEVTTGIYGHYGLFFLLPMKLLGADIVVVTALMALFGGISCAAVLYAVHHFLPKNWMRAIAACASVVHIAVLRATNYWQVHPIRVLFPTIFIAYGVFLRAERHNLGVKRIWIGWLLGVLAVIWNTESGLFCLLAFVLYLLVEKWQKYAWHDSRMYPYYLFALLFVVSGVAASVILVNLYNLLCGGPLLLGTFFFPHFTTGFVNDIRYDMVWGNHVWIYVLILFLLVFCWGIYHTKWFTNRKDFVWEDAPNAVMISALGIMSFSYYAMRAAFFNLDICFPMAICANVLVIGGLWKQVTREDSVAGLDSILKKSSVLVSMAVLVCLSLHILYAPKKMSNMHIAGYQSTVGLRQSANALAEVVPENTYGVGAGVSIIYNLLGWDNYGNYRDDPDLPVGGESAINELKQDVLKRDRFVVCDMLGRLQPILQDPRYVQKASIQISNSNPTLNTNFTYYMKRPDYLLGEKLTITEGFDLGNYFQTGISGVETDFAWTDGKEMQMVFLPANGSGQVLELQLDLKDVFNGSQKIIVEAAGTTLYEGQAVGAETIHIPIPAECVQDGLLVLSFHLPDAVSPAELGLSGDTRVLALAISSFSLNAV